MSCSAPTVSAEATAALRCAISSKWIATTLSWPRSRHWPTKARSTARSSDAQSKSTALPPTGRIPGTCDTVRRIRLAKERADQVGRPGKRNSADLLVRHVRRAAGFVGSALRLDCTAFDRSVMRLLGLAGLHGAVIDRAGRLGGHAQGLGLTVFDRSPRLA